MPQDLHLDGYVSFTIAILLLFVGKACTRRFELLRRYSIPEAVMGGLVCIVVVSALYLGIGLKVDFQLGVRDILLLYFFAAIGLGSDIRTLRQGGRPLLILVALASAFIVMQNLVGMAIASAFGLDHRAGLLTGSISLTGGVGTTLAWAPHFARDLGITNAETLGLASNMAGLIAACAIGGPIAAYLLRRRHVVSSAEAMLPAGGHYEDEERTRLDYNSVLMALLWLNVALILGRGVSAAIALTGLRLPEFVGCLIAGILVRNITAMFTKQKGQLWHWDRMRAGVSLISDICLGVFLTMALMGLQLWQMQGVATFVLTALTLQVLMAIAFTVLVVFRFMGRDYDAAVVCAGFGGITLGSTATAIANMSAVTREHGAAPRAFIVVPLVCGFFIDLVNAFVIGFMAR
ncbi:sodium/glutamate symporter [Variovorax sp. YR216]|uniref:sodium/glutamate symporter n=1 Tax=Variovorax sp. YR216 TaxID=1882828 RepID=UPI0008974E58|nr:sodium/glutamate symporter [Variovorax sp. YR216]SEB15408.1 glutamate:Na+ symporter, ESS family [Variovorax sp. YR216]